MTDRRELLKISPVGAGHHHHDHRRSRSASSSVAVRPRRLAKRRSRPLVPPTPRQPSDRGRTRLAGTRPGPRSPDKSLSAVQATRRARGARRTGLDHGSERGAATSATRRTRACGSPVEPVGLEAPRRRVRRSWRDLFRRRMRPIVGSFPEVPDAPSRRRAHRTYSRERSARAIQAARSKSRVLPVRPLDDVGDRLVAHPGEVGDGAE
jgi:hypothetical protein